MHQFDLLYMPSDTLYGNKYKYILVGIDATSRYKAVKQLRTKQVRDVAEIIADIYKVGPLTYPKIFQCDNGSKFKREMTKMLKKHKYRGDPASPEKMDRYTKLRTTSGTMNIHQQSSPLGDHKYRGDPLS